MHGGEVHNNSYHHHGMNASGIAGPHSAYDTCVVEKRLHECPHYELYGNGTLYSKAGFIGHQWESNATWILEWMEHHNDLKELMMCMCKCPLGLVFPPGNEACMKLGINSTYFPHHYASGPSESAGNFSMYNNSHYMHGGEAVSYTHLTLPTKA